MTIFTVTIQLSFALLQVDVLLDSKVLTENCTRLFTTTAIMSTLVFYGNCSTTMTSTILKSKTCQLRVQSAI